MQDILPEQIPPRLRRHNPRVVKKRTARALGFRARIGRSKQPRDKFPSKKPIPRTISSAPKQLTFSIFNSA